MTNGLPRGTDPGTLARTQLLRMARSAQAQGLVYEAIHTYYHLMDQYPRTEESRQAMEELVGLAQFLEGQGMYHMAKSMYQRLEEFA